MKILVLEYITGGGMRQESIPPSLAAEGDAMMQALVDDFLALSLGIELLVLRDDRLPLPIQGNCIQALMVNASVAFKTVWQACVNSCDSIWPIAPETDGILERLCQDVEMAGKALLSSPSSAVRIAASKLATARRLAKFGLPVVRSESLAGRKPPAWPSFVVKPDDGAGCDGIQIIEHASQFQAFPSGAGWVAQPLLVGEPISISVLFAHGRARLLSCNRQQIDRCGKSFALRGCVVNAFSDHDGRLQALAEGVARAIPALWGYAGIDLILTEDGPVILEINPRLTTSYAGLRLATGHNPAASVLHLLSTGQLPPLVKGVGKPVEIHLTEARR